MSEWRPRETAPKDGKPFLGLCIDSNGYYGPPRYTAQQVYWRESKGPSGGMFVSLTGAPLSHWMPLPEPPK